RRPGTCVSRASACSPPATSRSGRASCTSPRTSDGPRCRWPRPCAASRGSRTCRSRWGTTSAGPVPRKAPSARPAGSATTPCSRSGPGSRPVWWWTAPCSPVPPEARARSDTRPRCPAVTSAPAVASDSWTPTHSGPACWGASYRWAAGLLWDVAGLYGASGCAGEVGHATAVPGGDVCACGRIGCLDAYASGAGLLRRYGALSGRTDLRSVADLLRLLAEDQHARTVWDEAIDALAVGLCTTIMTVDPAVVSLVGGVSQAGEMLTGPLTERLTAELGWKSVPPLVVSPLQAIPGRAGAVMLGMRTGGGDRY